MTVNIDQSDRTWLMHVNGLLALLREPHHDALESSTLQRATQYVHNPTSLSGDEPGSDMSEKWRACLMLDISKLRLRTYVLEMEELLRSTGRPRQLDLQRIRCNVRRVYGDLSTCLTHIGENDGEIQRRMNWAHS